MRICGLVAEEKARTRLARRMLPGLARGGGNDFRCLKALQLCSKARWCHWESCATHSSSNCRHKWMKQMKQTCNRLGGWRSKLQLLFCRDYQVAMKSIDPRERKGYLLKIFFVFRCFSISLSEGSWTVLAYKNKIWEWTSSKLGFLNIQFM